jgi:hypothetical protein
MKIPVNFNIPKGYDRLFLLEIEGHKLVITVAGKRSLFVGKQGSIPDQYQSQVFDWIQESVEQIRMDCGADKE